MKKISKVIDTSNPFFELVDRLKIKKERYILGDLLSAKPGTRPSEQRGKKVSEQKLEALIWGLSHDNAVVRWQCLELLDAHPDHRAVPDILNLLNDPVALVRWHAIHSLECDACKAGESLLTPTLLSKINLLSKQEENKRVRSYVQRVVESGLED